MVCEAIATITNSGNQKMKLSQIRIDCQKSASDSFQLVTRLRTLAYPRPNGPPYR